MLIKIHFSGKTIGGIGHLASKQGIERHTVRNEVSCNTSLTFQSDEFTHTN